MEKKPKKVKIDLSQPDPVVDRNDPNVFVDDSAAELKRLQQDMLRRRMDRQNEDDDLQIKLNPAPPQSSIQNLLSPEDKQRVIASLNRDPKQEIKDYFQKMSDDQSRATEIASRGPFQEKTPEEQAFEEQNLSPIVRGLMGGGAMGSIAKVGAQQAVPAFTKLQQMMQVGNKRFPVQNTAQGLKVRDALQQTGEALPSKFGRVILKDR